MTKFICTKCSGFYNLDCTLETNSPYGLPDRCPFGVIKFGISWEVIEESPVNDRITAGSPPDPLPAVMSPHVPVRNRKSAGFSEGKFRSDLR